VFIDTTSVSTTRSLVKLFPALGLALPLKKICELSFPGRRFPQGTTLFGRNLEVNLDFWQIFARRPPGSAGRSENNRFIIKP
jgi:hypothetical protein